MVFPGEKNHSGSLPKMSVIAVIRANGGGLRVLLAKEAVLKASLRQVWLVGALKRPLRNSDSDALLPGSSAQ
ncbi:hypothetical protein MRX96_022784 [Rhipicephalus microplus]